MNIILRHIIVLILDIKVHSSCRWFLETLLVTSVTCTMAYICMTSLAVFEKIGSWSMVLLLAILLMLSTQILLIFWIFLYRADISDLNFRCTIVCLHVLMYWCYQHYVVKCMVASMILLLNVVLMLSTKILVVNCTFWDSGNNISDLDYMKHMNICIYIYLHECHDVIRIVYEIHGFRMILVFNHCSNVKQIDRFVRPRFFDNNNISFMYSIIRIYTNVSILSASPGEDVTV